MGLYSDHLRDFVGGAANEVAIIAFLCFSVERIFDVVVRLRPSVASRTTEETITRTLLSLRDALVAVNGDLSIESISKSLAATLLMQGPRKVKGKPFLQSS